MKIWYTKYELRNKNDNNEKNFLNSWKNLKESKVYFIHIKEIKDNYPMIKTGYSIKHIKILKNNIENFNQNWMILYE